MKISIVTDEISSDFETAVELATEWGIHDFELRGYGSLRVPKFSDFQKQRVQEICEEYHARIAAISPGLFKIPYPTKKRERFPLEVIDGGLYQKWSDTQRVFDYHCKELLPASLEYANQIKAKNLVIFSFARDPNSLSSVPDEICECLFTAAQQAEKAGIDLVIEVEDKFWADTGSHTAEIIQKVNQPALGVNWDAGNAYAAGDIPFPDGYQAVRKYVKHVHFKDLVASGDGNFSYAIQGEIDWQGQISALTADGYKGYISVEPHMQPKVASSKAVYQRLKALIGDAVS
jgi:sugar phosphate isomerase/epimerase